jgi:hypothetical protein
VKVCAEPRCPELTTSSRCPAHTRARDRSRGSRQARGYDRPHDLERARWAPAVARGIALCRKCGRRIAPGTPWDLGHTPDRTAWTGPEHARCNRSAAGRASHAEP